MAPGKLQAYRVLRLICLGFGYKLLEYFLAELGLKILALEDNVRLNAEGIIYFLNGSNNLQRLVMPFMWEPRKSSILLTLCT